MLIRTNLAAAVVSVSAFLAFSSYAQGQSCRGIGLTYIVRDQKGVAIDAASKRLGFDKDSGSPYSAWGVATGDFARNENMKLPDSITNLRGKIATLNSRGMCIFKQPLQLHLTLKGKTMNLTFLVPRLSEHDSRTFVVDSLPFQPGNFEIDLPADPDHSSRFYPATGWKKARATKP